MTLAELGRRVPPLVLFSLDHRGRVQAMPNLTNAKASVLDIALL